MKQDIINSIFEIFFDKCNDKIVLGENIDSYFMSFKKNDLLALCTFHAFVNTNNKDIYEAYTLRNKSKKEIINYIKNNLDKIILPFLKVVDEDIICELSEIKNSFVGYTIGDNKINIKMLMFLQRFSLAKIKFDISTNTILMHIPQEIINILKKYSKDSSLIEQRKENRKLFEFVDGVLNAYGIIPLDILIDICIQNKIVIEKEKLKKLITIWQILDKGLWIHEYYGKSLISCPEFSDVDLAIDFYEKTNKKYKILTQKQYKLIVENNFFQQTESYKKLYKYLNQNFDLDDDFTEEFDNVIIMDYIYSAQLSRETAKDNFYHNIDRIFNDLAEQDKDKIHSLIFDIFKEYPKWYKNGNK